MAAHDPQKLIVEGIYRSMAERDIDAFTGLVDPEIEVRQPAWLPYGGTHHGVEAMLAMFREMLALIDVRDFELRSLVAEDDDIWAELIVRTRFDGQPLHVAEHWRVRQERAAWLEVWIRDPTRILRHLESTDVD